jgi:hypothetical protein
MDIGTASSLSAYTYQSNLQSGGQSAAVLQALNSAYSNSSADALSSSDPLAALAGSSTVGPLVSGITALSQATAAAAGTPATSVSGLQTPTFGGLDSNSATALLASITTAGSTSGLQGFDAAVGGNSTIAIAAYQAQQAYPVSTPAAQTSPSTTPTTTVAVSDATPASTTPSAVAQASGTSAATTDANSPAAVQQAITAALSPSVLSLLA